MLTIVTDITARLEHANIYIYISMPEHPGRKSRTLTVRRGDSNGPSVAISPPLHENM